MEVFVGLYVEPVERSRVCVLCWYGEIYRSSAVENDSDTQRSTMYKRHTYMLLGGRTEGFTE